MKFNLHAHTTYSDGENSVYEMAKAYKENGYAFASITDHDYSLLESADSSKKSVRGISRFNMIRGAAREVSDILDFPVVVGLELSFYHDEMIMFGTEAILKWLGGDSCLAQKAVLGNNEADFKALSFLKENHALVVVHPCFKGSPWMYDVAHGYETYNRGRYFQNAEIRADNLKIVRNQFYGVDAHYVKDLVNLAPFCHDIDEDISNEYHLIDWIKARRT